MIGDEAVLRGTLLRVPQYTSSMSLLVALVVFLVLCIVMIAALAKSSPPTAIDTVEALCDAVIRGDVRTQKDLMTLRAVPDLVQASLGEMEDVHKDVAVSYNASVVETWDDAHASYETVRIPAADGDIIFTCRTAAMQWTIIEIERDVSHSELES